MTTDLRKFLNADGSYKRVDIRDLATQGRWGVQLYSTSEHAITIGEKTWTVDEAVSGRIKVGDEIQCTAIQHIECSMWGIVTVVDETTNEITAIFAASDLSPVIGGPFNEWEIQITSRARDAIERAFSASSIDPTDAGPFTLTVPADRFFPVNGQVILRALASDPAIVLLARVIAYAGTTLYLAKNETNAAISESFSSWAVELIDAPPVAATALSISGLGTTRVANEHKYIIQPGSIVDSTGTVLLTLDAALTKRTNEAFAAGDDAGAVVLVPMTGTASSSGSTVVGTGTNFSGSNGEVATSVEMNHVIAQGYTSVMSSMIGGSDGAGNLVGTIFSDTSLSTSRDIGLSAETPYRGALAGILSTTDFGGYICLFRNPDGTVDSCVTSSTRSGEPDLPAGATHYAIIAVITGLTAINPASSSYTIIMPLYALQPYSMPDGVIPNTALQNMGAYSLKMRNASTSGEPTDVAITALTQKVTLAAADKFLISDSAASGALKYVEQSDLLSGVGATGDDDSFAILLETIADIKGAVHYSYGNGITWFADTFDTTTSLDLVTSTQEETSTPGQIGVNVLSAASDAITSDTSIMVGATLIGDMTAGGGLAAARDSATNQASGSCAGKAATQDAYLGGTLANAKSITFATIYGSNNQGYFQGSNPSMTFELYGKTGAAPANSADGTLLGTLTFTDTSNESGGRTISSTDQVTTWDHIWIRLTTAAAANTMYVAEFGFNSSGAEIGDFTTMLAAFDGTTSQALAASAQKAAATEGYIGHQLISTTDRIRIVASAVVRGSNNSGFVNSINPTVTLELYGKTGAAPTNSTDGTLLGTLTFTDTANESAGRTIASNDTLSSWDWAWVRITHNGAANTLAVAEITLTNVPFMQDLLLQSETLTPLLPSSVSTITMWTAVNLLGWAPIVVNTNLELFASRNGGTDFTEGVAGAIATQIDGIVWYKSVIDVSAQTGTENQVEWKIETGRSGNPPNVTIHAVVLKIE